MGFIKGHDPAEAYFGNSSLDFSSVFLCLHPSLNLYTLLRDGGHRGCDTVKLSMRISASFPPRLATNSNQHEDPILGRDPRITNRCSKAIDQPTWTEP